MFRQNQDMIRSNYICKSYDKSDKCEIEKQEINKEAKTDFSSESQIIKTEKSRSIVENESQVNSEKDKISQETIKENFPFPTFLKDQLEILTEIVDAIEDGKSKDKIAENTDITVNELNKIIDLGSQNDRICREVYEEYESVYLSKHLEVFLKEIKNKNLKKALKTSGIEKSELDSAYNSGKNGDERFTKFYNDYLNFKISCYITQIIRGKTISKALKNSNLTDEELKDNLKEIESRILDKQMNSVIGEIAKNRTTRQAAKKARIRIDEVYRWYLEGKKGNEKFKDFADIYHELYVEVGCEIFQNFLNKGKTPKQILKIMNEDITREDYEFWIKNNLISDKNVEAKLYTEDEIKEKIENEGFRQKEEKSLSGLSIIGC